MAVDFATESLPRALRAAGLRNEEPSFFSWLGVTPYLESANVPETLQAIAPFAKNGGGLVFDYNVPPASLAPARRAAFEALADRVAAAGKVFDALKTGAGDIAFLAIDPARAAQATRLAIFTEGK